MTQRILDGITKYKFSFLLFLLLLAIVLFPINFAPSIPIILGTISVFLLFWLCVSNQYYVVTVCVFTILISFDAYLSFVLSSRMNLGFLGSIMETNLIEAFSMLKSMWLSVLICLSVLGSLFYMSAKELRKSDLSIKVITYSSLISFVLIILIFIRGYKREDLARYINEYPALVCHNLVITYTPLLYSNITGIAAYYEELNRFRGMMYSDQKPLPHGISLSERTDKPTKIFVIIGESSSWDHYSLFGYDEPTTPFLDSLSSNLDDKFFYYKGSTCANVTRNALRLTLSFASPHNLNRFFEEKSAINLLSDVGYETVWISNQGNESLDETYINYLAQSADSTYFDQSSYFYSNDKDLIAPIKRYIRSGEKQALFIHTVGSHMNYADRYTKENADAINSKIQSCTEYDRTIHATDCFLRQVYNIAMSGGDDFVIYYFSDHGEDIGRGHGHKKGSGQFKIPILAVNNSNVAVDSIIKKYINPQTHMVSNISTSYILAEIAGYTIDSAEVKFVLDEGKYVYHSDQSIGLLSEVED